MADPKNIKLDDIYRTFSSVDEIVASETGNRINATSTEDINIISQLQQLLVSKANGIYKISDIIKKINELRSGANDVQNKIINRLISFYSTETGLNTDVNAFPYIHKSGGITQIDIDFKQIVGGNYQDKDLPTSPKFSICVSRSPLISPMVRESDKTEIFLNYMPSIVLSRCVPYFEAEFVFNRPSNGSLGNLTTPSLLKFLLGSATVNESGVTATDIMYRGQQKSKKIDGKERNITSSGMEMFTAPQTLINMDYTTNKGRYIGVLDPTRPLASIENASIKITPTTGIMSHKSATLSIKLHDRTRMAEIVDMIQPTSYVGTTVWLTYGWRHPRDELDAKLESYADFINNNMLIREAYGVSNSSFTFDTTGQVSINLILSTQSVFRLEQITLLDDGELFALRKTQEELSKEIKEIINQNQIEPPKNVEVRPYTILNAAGDNVFPDLNPQDVESSISKLASYLQAKQKPENSDNKPSVVPQDQIDELIKKINQYYFGNKGTRNSKDGKLFYFQAEAKRRATETVRKKFEQLQKTGNDPFLIFREPNGDIDKHEAMMEEFGYPNATFPYIDEIEDYIQNPADKVFATEFQKELNFPLNNQVVSFGKLFTMFVVPAVIAADQCDECQIYFYNLNDLAGKAAGTNLAEFPIDLPLFIYQYREELKNATAITIENFVKFIANSQISDYRAIPYGFRSKKGIFKPWNKETQGFDIDDKKSEEFAGFTKSLNDDRGFFQLPVLSVYLEMSYEKASNDILESLRNADVLNNPYGDTQRRILKIHVFDKSLNAYPGPSNILKEFHDGKKPGFKYIAQYSGYNPFLKTSNPSQKELILNGEPTDREKVYNFVSSQVPTLVPGMNASSIIEASISTKQDSQLGSSQMLGLNSGRNVDATPRGSGKGNLPVKVIPGALTMKTVGCPTISYVNQFFVNLNTGTTLDNIYGVSGITHNIAPGSFTSDLQFSWLDAYGKYEPPKELINQIYDALEKLKSTNGSAE